MSGDKVPVRDYKNFDEGIWKAALEIAEKICDRAVSGIPGVTMVFLSKDRFEALVGKIYRKIRKELNKKLRNPLYKPEITVTYKLP